MKEIKLFDSFAGIGALHKSITRLGLPIKLVGMSEIDIDAILDYYAIHYGDIGELIDENIDLMREYLKERNIGYDFKKKKSKINGLRVDKLKKLYTVCIKLNNFGDIGKIQPKDLPDFDLFNFSFPCTKISVAGTQEGFTNENGELTESGLYTYGIEVLKEKKPTYVMIENVKNLIQKKFIDDFYNIIKEVEEIGYSCYFPMDLKNKPLSLNALDFGVPQNRERIYVICIRKDKDINNFQFPLKNNKYIKLENILDDDVDSSFNISEFLAQTVSPYLPDNINHKNIIDLSHFRQEKALRIYKEYAPTLNTRDYKEPRIVYLKHNSEKCIMRKLTPLECFRLMGFDDEDYYRCAAMGTSNTELYKQTGNSIVVNVLYYIFKELFKEYIL